MPFTASLDVSWQRLGSATTARSPGDPTRGYLRRTAPVESRDQDKMLTFAHSSRAGSDCTAAQVITNDSLVVPFTSVCTGVERQTGDIGLFGRLTALPEIATGSVQSSNQTSVHGTELPSVRLVVGYFSSRSECPLWRHNLCLGGCQPLLNVPFLLSLLLSSNRDSRDGQISASIVTVETSPLHKILRFLPIKVTSRALTLAASQIL